MNKNTLYVYELRAILACGQSDGSLKEWAKVRLEKIERQTSSAADLKKVPVLVG
jgi:hypothetical protein